MVSKFKISTKEFFGPNLKEILCKIRLSISVRNFAAQNEPPNIFFNFIVTPKFIMALVYNTVPNQSLGLLQVLVSITQAIYSLSGLGFSKRAGNSAVSNHTKIRNYANVDLVISTFI